MTFHFGFAGKRPLSPLQASGENFNPRDDKFKGSSENRLRRWVITGVLLTMLLTGFMSFLIWQSTREGEEGQDWVVHTHLVEQRLQAAVSNSTGAANRARVFAVTGNKTVLDPYKNKLLAFAQDLKTLRELTADNPSQQRHLDELGPHVAASMDSERKIQDERERTGAPPSASELVEDKLHMDAVKATLVVMQGEEAGLLTQRIGKTQQIRQQTRTVVLSTALVGIALLILSGIFLLREIHRSARMGGHVKILNDELDQQATENRRVEEERKSLRYARSLIEACLDPLVTICREGKITDVNEAATKVTGTSRESLIGSDFSDFFTDPESARRGYEQAFEQGAVKDYPLSIRNAEGNVTDVLYNASVFKDETGQVQGVFAAARDITEQKEAAEALLSLNSQLEHYRIVVEHIDGYAIYTLDTEGIITSWGAGAQKTSGIRPEDVIGRHYSFFFPAEEVLAGEPQRQLAEAARTGCCTKDGWMVKPDGDRRWASGALNAVRDESGKLTGFIRVGRDMTHYKQADEDLREANRALAASEERFRLLVESVHDYAINLLDVDGRILTWNEGSRRIHGMTEGEALGQNYSIFFPAAEAAKGEPAQCLEEAARSGHYHAAGWRLGAQGKRIWAEVDFTAMPDASGQLTGFTRVLRDMTGQKEAAEALQNINSQLEHYRIVVEHIDEYAIYTLDAEGIITSWGAGAQKVSGATAEEVIGQHYSFFFPSAAVLAGVPQRELAEAARVGRYAVDAWMITPDGDRKWSSGVLTAVRNEGGELTGFIRVARDMTSYKQADEDLRLANRALVESEERFRLLVEPVKDYAIYMLDPKGCILTWNEGAKRCQGYTAAEVIGRHLSMFFLPEDVEAGLPATELESAEREGRFETEGWRVRKDGTKFWALVTLTATYGQDGTLRGFAKVMRDMTSQKQAIEDLRQANRALVESEERFRLLVEPVKDYGIFMLDPEGRVVTWNVGAERIKGYKTEDVLGKNFSIFFLPEDADAGLPAQELATAAREGRFEAETWRVRKDGTKFWALVTLTAIYGQDGALRGFAKVFRDMTSQKQAIEDLRLANRALVESEERFRLLVEPVKDYGIYMLDPKGRVVTWNEGAERSEGYKAAEVLGKNFSIFFLPEDADAGLPAQELAMAARDGRFETEAWCLHKDGTKFWALMTLTAIHGQDGALRGFAKVTRDMTSQKLAIENLRLANRALVESEERFRLLVEPVKDYAIYMLDPEGRILTWNEGAERSKGYKAAEVVGQNFAIFYLPEDAQAGVPVAELATAAREGRLETAAWRVRKDGTMFWGLITLTALERQDGVLRGFATVTRDMTAQKQLEDSLQHLAADLETRVDERTRQLESTLVELRHKNDEVEAFVYIVSHDMRAPLVNLMGFARELGESCTRLKLLIESFNLPGAQSAAVFEVLDADLPSAVHFISQSSLKFERLIDALLDLSRYGRQIYRIVESNAGELVASAVANFQQAITEAGATVTVGPLPSVRADVTALGQVFANLIGNSLKYRSPDRPLKLEIGGGIEAGAVNYWVRDNGLGIPEASKSRLFQVFQRFHPQQAQGEGMGLAIAHRIIERHGGRIWAESREGEGTTFHFSLPGIGAPSIPGSGEDVIQEAIVHGSN
jgi:PAS domain S-box-containing protein